jgi:hypothetical protein
MPTGRLDPRLATESKRRGEAGLLRQRPVRVPAPGKVLSALSLIAQARSGHHSGLAFTDHQMHDLKLERFLKELGNGPIKTFTLRGIKDSPPLSAR